MSFSHSGTPQPFLEDHVPSGSSSMDAQGRSNSHHSIPTRARDSANGAIEDYPVSEHTPLLQPPPPIPGPANDGAMSTEQMPTSKILREEVCVLASYSFPIFGAQLFEYSFIMASVICIGHISTLALAAATLGSMTASVTGYSIVQGFASALETLLPPAWTSDKPYMVGLWTQRMVLLTGIILIPITAIWLRAEPILLALNQEPEVAQLAGIYLRWASLGLPAYSFNCITRRYFQSQGLFDVPTRIIILIAPFNAFLNWLLVYPLGMSFPGAPLATALSFNLVSLAYIFYGYHYTPRTAWSPITRESLKPASGEIWKGWGLLTKLGVGGVGEIATEWWCWESVGLAASQLGSVALAAQSVLLISASTTFQTPLALSIATSVRIGNLLGEGNARRARVTAAISVVIGIAIGCIFGGTFLVFRYQWSYLFNDDPEVVSLVASILPIVALLQILDGMTSVSSGILRARGKQVVGAILSMSAYYALGIPLGLYLAFVRGHALSGLWEGLTVGLIFCAGVGFWISVVGVDWKVEAAEARVRVGVKD